MDFDQELMKLMRSNTRFRSAVCDVLLDVFETLDDGNFTKGTFLQKFAKRERDSSKSSIDTIRRIMKTKIQQLLKNTSESLAESAVFVDEPVKTAEMTFPLRTLDDLEAGGYKDHYKTNTHVDAEQSNHVDKLFPTRAPAGTDSKSSKGKDEVGFEHFQPMHYCPKCKGTNLFNSMLSEYVECDDCDSMVLRESLLSEETLES